MIGSLAPAHLALVLVAASGSVLLVTVLVMVRAARRRHATHTISAATVADAWGRWADGRALSDAERTLRNALLELLDAAALAAVRDDLERLERATLPLARPLLAVREELMASVDRRMLNAEILRLPDHLKSRVRAHSQDVQQSDAEARRYIAANEWRLHVLREYASLRYGDKADGDWFAVYERAAQLKQRGLRSALERALEGGASDPRAAQIASVDDELKRRLLAVPPGARFPAVGARELA